ncbi:hypothetical protein TraAM80_04393, partial [Trypanosoma rangeli]
APGAYRTILLDGGCFGLLPLAPVSAATAPHCQKWRQPRRIVFALRATTISSLFCCVTMRVAGWCGEVKNAPVLASCQGALVLEHACSAGGLACVCRPLVHAKGQRDLVPV